jgi:hypothetical protein
VKGGERLEVDRDGRLNVNAALGEVSFTRPVAYQEIGGKRKMLEVSCRLMGKITYGG